MTGQCHNVQTDSQAGGMAEAKNGLQWAQKASGRPSACANPLRFASHGKQNDE